MPIPLQQARTLIANLQIPQIRNLFAQAHARHVLHEVGEDAENFPAFDLNLDDKVTASAYALLAAGCSIIEQADRSEGSAVVERAASLLHHVHGPTAVVSRVSSFHVLVSSMAFYAAGHYSRAFVTIRSVEGQTQAARIVATFIRKDIHSLITCLNQVLLIETPAFEDQMDLDEWAITLAMARAAASALDFVFTGDVEDLSYADRQLGDAAVIAASGNHSAWWWVVRLFRLMLSDLGEASPWQVLPPLLGDSCRPSVSKYVRLLAFARHPVMELWSSQRAALPLALSAGNRGAVINLRTSAGKTRVAELSILQVLVGDPTARVLYLAPFRSLAMEVEHTLSDTFSWLGYGVSHLYGGSRVSSVDTQLAAESAITIATPEKARALLRASPELFENLRLIVIDEGHLIGASERYVRNEVFLDHLRIIAQANGARLLLLSAVLPNPQELAEWVTGDGNSVATSSWKPSAERFGLLRWNGSRVKIEWQGEVASFNPSFVAAGPLGFGGRRNPFPNNKNEAVAASAVRLSSIGPVMIFSGRAASVPNLAESVLLALGQSPADHPWPDHEWRVFEAVCREELADDAIEVRAARAGVVCHSNRLTPQVRLATEHLMRSKPPRIIIATTTLGQGVNIGVSSVIVSTPYISKETIDKRDFWNICGRAGRAFVDGEGKILYAIDDTRESWQVRKDENLAKGYFRAGGGDRVESGLLFVVGLLRTIAASAGVSFEMLLEMAASNDFSRLGNESNDVEALCDLLDGELLALHADPAVNPDGAAPTVWVEHVFRHSLAALQARSSGSVTGADDVVAFLRARADASLGRVPQSMRRGVISSGLPLSTAIRASESRELFAAVAASCEAEPAPVAVLATAVRQIEEWSRSNAGSVIENMPSVDRLDTIREGWLGGVDLKALGSLDADACAITKDLYGYQLPWILHAASQQLRSADETEKADILARIALLVELGVPSERAARIFLAGIRSRSAATELAGLDVAWSLRILEIARCLRDPEFAEQLGPQVSASTASWLDLMTAEAARRQTAPIPRFPHFTLPGSEEAEVLHARMLGDRVFLMTTNGETKIAVRITQMLPFDRVADDPRVVFSKHGEAWKLVLRDPRARLESRT